MKINAASLQLWPTLAVVVACLSAAFQYGFFSEVGIQFLGLASVQDWLFVGAAQLPLLLLAMAAADLTALLFQRFEGKKKIPWWRWVLIAGPAPPFMFIFIGWFAHYSWLFAACAAVLLIPAYIEIKSDGEFDAGTALFALFFLCLHQFFMGAHIADQRTRDLCDILLEKTIYRDVSYLRYFGDGHLVKMGSTAIFLPKSEVKEVRCKSRVETHQERGR